MGWVATDLSVNPPSWQLAEGDREFFGFDAAEAITGAAARLYDLADMTDVTTGRVVDPDNLPITGTTATAEVSNLTRGREYLLVIRFTTPAGRKFSRTLVLLCVA
jgi:hypothetical protein